MKRKKAMVIRQKVVYYTYKYSCPKCKLICMDHSMHPNILVSRCSCGQEIILDWENMKEENAK